MTIKELKEALDKLGISYANDAKLADLQALYDEAQIPFEVKPGQIVKVLTKDSEGNEIEGEMELDSLIENLKAELDEEISQHEVTKDQLHEEQYQHEITQQKLAGKSGVSKTKEGLNIVYLQTPLGIEKRFRAGISITKERIRHEVTDEQLALLQSDNAVLISQGE